MIGRTAGFFAVIAVILAVGCSNGSLPARYPSAALDHAAVRHPIAAHVTLVIPRPKARRAHYVSPGTASFAVVVTPVSNGVAGSPLPLQILEVNAKNCPTTTALGPLGGLRCRFPVLVVPGEDTFSFVAYSKANAKGSILSAYESGTPIAIPSSGSLGFGLDAVVGSIVMFVPGSLYVPSSQNVPVPIGSPTSVPVIVIPYDPAGYPIIEGVRTATPRSSSGTSTPLPYLQPFTIGVTPANAGITLSNDRGSGQSVTVQNPRDLAIDVVYDGVARFKGSDIVQTSFVLTPSFSTPSVRPTSRPRVLVVPTPAPNMLAVNLASNAVGYSIAPAPGSESYNNPEGLAYNATQKSFAFASYVSGGNRIGAFTFDGKSVNVSLAIPSGSAQFAGYPFVDSLGDVWFTSGSSPNALCYSQFASATPNLTVNVMPYQPTSGAFVQGITQDVAGNMWFTGQQGYGYGGFSYAALTGKCQLGSLLGSVFKYALSSPYLYAVGPQASGAGVWTGDSNSNYLFQVNKGTPSSPAPNVNAVSSGTNTDFYGFARRSGGTVYAFGLSSPNDVLSTVAPNGTLTTVGTMPYQAVNGPTFAMSPTAVRIAYSGTNGSNTFLFDLNSSTVLNLPMPLGAGGGFPPSCQGETFDATGTPWVLCSRPNDGSLAAFRVLLTNTWSVFPPGNIAIDLNPNCSNFSYDIAVGESLSQNSGPFTAVSNNTSIASFVGTVTGYSHLLRFLLHAVPGTAVITISDNNGKTLPLTLTMTSDSSGYYCGG